MRKSYPTCPYCGEKVEFTDSKVIYGKSYGMIYLCVPCDAYVGAHRDTNRPLGTLANKGLREWRKKAHAAFDPLWTENRMSRTCAYRHMRNCMKLSNRDAHIAMFDIEQCKLLIEKIGQMQTLAKK